MRKNKNNKNSISKTLMTLVIFCAMFFSFLVMPTTENVNAERYGGFQVQQIGGLNVNVGTTYVGETFMNVPPAGAPQFYWKSSFSGSQCWHAFDFEKRQAIPATWFGKQVKLTWNAIFNNDQVPSDAMLIQGAASYTWENMETGQKVTKNEAVYACDDGDNDWGGGQMGIDAPVTAYNPIVTANPDLVKTLNDPITTGTWAENITATWGYTIANTIPTKGTIDDTSLVANNDLTLSSDGTVFNKIGYKVHNYMIRDDWSNDNVTYPLDNTQTATSRKIIVKTDTKPDIIAKYSAGSVDKNGNNISGQVYNGGWTNQKLDLSVATEDPGTYDITLKKEATEVGFKSAANVANGDSYTYANYGVQSSTFSGENFSGILLGTGDHTIELSPETNNKNVKIDTTNPVAAATYNAGNFTDASTDDLSGINASDNKIALVAHGAPAPANEEYVSFGSLVVNPGAYDVYVWAWDNAGNNVKVKALDNVIVKSLQASTIMGELASGANTGNSLASNVWTNQDVKVIAKAPVPDIGGTYYSALYTGAGTIQEGKQSTPTINYEKLYTSNTPYTGITLNSVVVDGTDNFLSEFSGDYVVKIDKDKPTAGAQINASWGFDDLSTDTLSGVKETKIAVIPTDQAPVDGDYELISSASLPASGYYDVWVVTYDNAGNISDAQKIYENISRSNIDIISAIDFSYGLDQGATNFTDDLAKQLGEAKGRKNGGGNFPMSALLVNATQKGIITTAITNSNKAIYPLEFATPVSATQAQKQINVTLYDHGKGSQATDKLYGNDFTYGINNGAISNEVAKQLAAVNGKDAANNPYTYADIDVNATDLATINAAIAANDKSGNPFSLGFSTPDGTAIVVLVTLKDFGGQIVSGKEKITANNFSYGIDEGAMSADVAKILSQVEAKTALGFSISKSAITIDTAEFAAINSAIAANDKSSNPMPLTFSTPDGTSVTIKVTLKDHGNGDIVNGEEHITGNDFAYGINQGNISNDLAKEYAKVFANETDGDVIALSSIDVNATELAAINAAIAANDKSGNPFPLTFSTPDGTSVTVKVTLKDHGNGPIVPNDNKEKITGNNFSYGVNEAKVTKTIAASLGYVEAVDVNGNDIKVSDLQVNTGELKAITDAQEAGETGSYPLTFSTPDGTSITIMVTLKDKGAGVVDPIDRGNNTDHITANDFSYGVDEPSLTEAISKHLSDVSAIDKDSATVPLGSITTDTGELQDIIDGQAAGKTGAYPLTYTTPDGTSVTITVTLKDKGAGVIDTVDPSNNTDHIVANDFGYGVDEPKLTEAIAENLSKVVGNDKDGNKLSLNDITADSVQLKVITDAQKAGKTGEYPLTFSTPDGTNVTIIVTLRNHGGGNIDPLRPKDNTDHIVANDFTHKVVDGTLTANDIKNFAAVYATDKYGNDIDVSKIKVDKATMDKINEMIQMNEGGKYKATFISVDGTEVTITVTIIPEAAQNIISAPELPDTGSMEMVAAIVMMIAVIGLGSGYYFNKKRA